MSLDKNNKAYDNLGMSDLMKSRIYERCMEKGKEDKDEIIVNSFGASLDNTRNRDITTIFLDSSDLVRVRKKSSKYEKIMKCVASVVFIAFLSSMVIFGKKYYDGVNDKNVALKEGTTKEVEKDTENVFNVIRSVNRRRDQVGLEEYYRSNISDYLFESYGENRSQNTDYKKYIDECYDSNGKLKKGYEVREYDLKTNGKTVNKIKLVGKDFIFISAKEAKDNSDIVKEEYLSEIEDSELEVAKKICAEYGDEFAAHDYVYYLQGTNLLRVRLDATAETWICNSDCYEYIKNKYSYHKYLGLKKVEGKVVVFTKEMEVKKPIIDLDTIKTFKDVNVIYGNVFKIIDKESEQEIKDIKYLYIKLSYQSGKNVIYYVDSNYNLWRIKNVKFYKKKSDEINGSLYKNEGLVEYNHKKDINGQLEIVFGVDKDYKAEKIAENVYVEEYYMDVLSPDYNEGFVIRENIEISKRRGFKKLVDDEHVIYKESEE